MIQSVIPRACGSGKIAEDNQEDNKMKILVDAERMKVISGEINTTVDTLRNNMDNIELLVNGLNGEWQGDAERAYASRLVYVRKEFKEVEKFFTEYATMLSRFSEEYLRHEDEVAAKIINV